MTLKCFYRTSYSEEEEEEDFIPLKSFSGMVFCSLAPDRAPSPFTYCFVQCTKKYILSGCCNDYANIILYVKAHFRCKDRKETICLVALKSSRACFCLYTFYMEETSLEYHPVHNVGIMHDRCFQFVKAVLSTYVFSLNFYTQSFPY